MNDHPQVVVCKMRNMEWNGLVEWTHGMDLWNGLTKWLGYIIMKNYYKKKNQSLSAQDTSNSLSSWLLKVPRESLKRVWLCGTRNAIDSWNGPRSYTLLSAVKIINGDR